MAYFPEEVLEYVFDFLTSHGDRNAVSLVCKAWFRVERWSRKRVFVGNCYAVSPERFISRFPRVRSLSLKGKPHFADFNLVPDDWGALVDPWIEAMAESCPLLEELRLKRMVVSDESLDLLSRSFDNFKSLVLISCEGFSTDGLASIAANCKSLKELDLEENDVEERRCPWLSCFPESFTSLVSLNFACLKGEVNLGALARLVGRCRNLRSLRLNRSVPLETLLKIVHGAPQLVDLGVGSFVHEPESEPCDKLINAFRTCKSLKSLSGFWEVAPRCLSSVYPVCSNLLSLNLSYATAIQGGDLIKLVSHCQELRRLWILDCIGDQGLEVVASTCERLQELRVFPSDPYGASVTEKGLVAVSSGCPKLNSLLYFCQKMTNSALVTVASNCPNFIRFRLSIFDPLIPDHVTLQPLDEGFGAIVKSCKSLRRLSMSGKLTDQVFWYIGTYAKRLEMLSVAFAGDSDKGMIYVLNGCTSLRKLEIRDSPFGDIALLSDFSKYETMRSLWMSQCDVTLGACKALAKKMPTLNVEVIAEREPMDEMQDNHKVEKMYVYRTLVGPRKDAPDFVSTV